MNADSGVDEHANSDDNEYQTSIAITAFCQMLLFVQLVGVAASVDVLMLRRAMIKWRPILLGLAIQYMLLTPIGAVISAVYDLPPPYDAALISTMAMPGGIYSAWWCSLLNADIAVSIALSAWNTLFSVVAVPLNLILYIRFMKGHGTTWGSISWSYLLTGMAMSYTALLFGTLLSWRYPWRRKTFYFAGNLCGYVLFFVGCVLSWSEGGEPVWNKPWVLYPAILSSVLSSLFISLALALGTIKFKERCSCLGSRLPNRKVPRPRLPKRLLRFSIFAPPEVVEWEGVERQKHAEAVAVTVSSLYQNTGLAISFVLGTFQSHEREDAASVPVLYGISQSTILPIFLFAAWKMGWLYAPPETPFFAALLNDFQPHRGCDRVETFRSQRNLRKLSEATCDEVAVAHVSDIDPVGSPSGNPPTVLPWTRREGVTPWQVGPGAACSDGGSDGENPAFSWDSLPSDERERRSEALAAFFPGVTAERLDAALKKHKGHAGKAKTELQSEEGALLLGDWCWEGGGQLTIECKARSKGRVFHVSHCHPRVGADLVAGDLRLDGEWWLVDLSPVAVAGGSSTSPTSSPAAVSEPIVVSTLRLQRRAAAESGDAGHALLMSFQTAGDPEWGPPVRAHEALMRPLRLEVKALSGDDAPPSPRETSPPQGETL